MILYLDTSSLIKLFIEEEGSETVRRMANEAEGVASSLIAYTEVRAALARARQAGRLRAETHREAIEDFNTSWPTYSALPVTEDLVRIAGDLAEKHLLKGFDAIHLASALHLHRESAQPVSFSAWDERLMAAAAAEGLAVAT